MTETSEKITTKVEVKAHVYKDQPVLYFEALFDLPVGFEGTYADAIDLMSEYLKEKREAFDLEAASDHVHELLTKASENMRWEPYEKHRQHIMSDHRNVRAGGLRVSTRQMLLNDLVPGVESTWDGEEDVAKESFGERVKRERTDRGWSQEKLGGLIGSVNTLISRMERDAVNIGPAYRLAACGVLGINPDDYHEEIHREASDDGNR